MIENPERAMLKVKRRVDGTAQTILTQESLPFIARWPGLQRMADPDFHLEALLVAQDAREILISYNASGERLPARPRIFCKRNCTTAHVRETQRRLLPPKHDALPAR